MTYYTRAQWGARSANGGPGDLDPSEVVGICLHWPAMSSPLRDPATVKAALRGWQNFHIDTRGWSDIAYQEAIDQSGNVYELRGLRRQSGANGGTDVNERYGALLLILAPGEGPTAAMMTAARERIAEHRRLFPRSTEIRGHGEIRPEPTACPGPAAQQLINHGSFEPLASTGPLRKAITRAVKQAKKIQRDGVATRLQRIRNRLPKS